MKELESRNRELKKSVNAVNSSLKKLEKEKKDLETVILLQEEKIARLEKATTSRKEKIKKCEETIDDLTTMNEELKRKMVNLKQFYNENESKEITSLKNKLINLENMLESK